MTIYVDLDGVLADFHARAEEILGYRYPGVSAQIAWQTLGKVPGLFRNLKLRPDALLLWEGLSRYNPKILTALPSALVMPSAVEDKIAWVAEHFGDVEVLFGPYAINKQRYARPGDVLIDDNHLNIAQWNGKGGVGIFHKSAPCTLARLAELFEKVET